MCMPRNSGRSPVSNIPQTRDQLFTFAEKLRAIGLEEMAEELEGIINDGMYRHHVKERAPTRSRKMTPMVIRMIKLLNRQHPEWSTQEVGEKVGGNPGRVSEVLAGKWDD